MKNSDIWKLYCSESEYTTSIKDKFNRPITNYTRPGNMLDPNVSSFLNQEGFKPKYPNNKKFATCISHDVDSLFVKSGKKILLKKILKLNYSQIKQEIDRNFFRKIDPSLDLQNLLKINNQHNIKSTYYFLSIENENNEDYNYYLKEIEHYFKIIKDYGNEIGLHGSRKAFNNIDELHKEKKRLEHFEKNILGYRNHFLKFEIPTTWHNLAKEGIKYDTTFGSPSCPGFRNGMCYPYQPYDLNTNKLIDIYELPLIAMDVSFFLYLKLDYNKAFELFKNLVQTVKKHNGVFTFLWHNSYMTGKMLEFYIKCIKYLKEEDTWFSTGNEIIDWWEKNDYFNAQNTLLNKIKP